MAPRGSHTFPWPPEAVEMLRKYWGEGASASYVAARINATYFAGVTRNAVIGKIHRLKLNRSQEMNRRNHSRSGGRKGCSRTNIRFGKGEVAARKPPAPPPPIPVVTVSRITGAIIPGPSPIPPRPLPDPAPASGPLIDIMAITSGNCCWPVERGGEFDEWLFCGGERDPKSGAGHDRGYCAKHWRTATGRRAA